MSAFFELPCQPQFQAFSADTPARGNQSPDIAYAADLWNALCRHPDDSSHNITEDFMHFPIGTNKKEVAEWLFRLQPRLKNAARR